LIASDIDGVQRDIYDARVDGGFALAPGGESGSCAATACEASGTVLGGAIPTSVINPGEAPMAMSTTITGKMGVQVKKTKGHDSASKLTSALRTCRAKPKRQRAACERAARKRYESKVKAKKSLRRG
jgi:hypothetical protein